MILANTPALTVSSNSHTRSVPSKSFWRFMFNGFSQSLRTNSSPVYLTSRLYSRRPFELIDFNGVRNWRWTQHYCGHSIIVDIELLWTQHYCSSEPSGYYTYRLTHKIFTFCPHSVYICFVWISEQTAIISLYSINWLVFITETESVYVPVWSEPLLDI